MAFSQSYAVGEYGQGDFIALQVCLPLDRMGATLVVHAMIPVGFYDEALPVFNDLVDEISIDFR